MSLLSKIAISTKDNEERILATKSNNSQNMSTSEVAREGLPDSLGRNKNLRGTVEKDRRAYCVPPRLMVVKPQVSTESNDKEKVHWKPPFKTDKPLG